jgi:hypothetical protein
MLAGVTYPHKDPVAISINPTATFGTKYGTFEHERQHLLDKKRGATELRYPAPEYVFENAKWEKQSIPIDEKLQSKTRDDIILSYQKYRKKYDLSNDYTQEGFFGDIRAIEKRLPAGKGILDTDIGKDLFGNNPELLLTYWSRTRPEKTTYMTEQRDSPRFKNLDMRQAKKAPEAGPLTKVQDFIRAKTATYFKNGGEADKFDAEVLANARLSPDYYAEADKGLIVERAEGKALKDFDKRIAEQALGTNVAVDPSRYIRKDDTIFPYSQRLTVHGWVDPANPDQVHIQADPGEKFRDFLKRLKAKDKNMQSSFDRVSDKTSLNALVHEMTHSNQTKEAFLPEAEYMKKMLIEDRYNKAIDLQNNIDKEDYYNPMSGSGLKERELGAYLNSYEGIHPSAKTVSGKQAVVPFEKSYLGKQVLPPAKGLLKLIEDMGGFTYFGSAQDPETLKYVNKMMGREKRKPTPKK